ncbi:MAG: hypothetical protein ACR2IT_00395 [Pirellulales bacterium]
MMNLHPDLPAATPRGRAAVILTAGRTELAFQWIGDRWEHGVTVDGELVARSVEGTTDGGDPRWPASPVFVELSQLMARGRPAILAVGLAGRSHFSASVVPATAKPDTLLFEIACRLQEVPVRLGSTYACNDGPVHMAAAVDSSRLPGTIQWAYTIGPEGIRVTGPADATEAPG